MKRNSVKTKKIALTAILAAAAAVLIFINFPVPALMPSFIKFDISDMPALLASFTMGPLSGVVVAFIKNLVNFILGSSTMGVGELSNFLLACLFVVPAGFIYKSNRTFKGACIGAVTGAFAMSICGVFTNYFIVYPAYETIMGLPMPAIIGMYNAINPACDTLLEALVWFNLPFTFIKASINAAIVFLIYKRLSNLIKKFDK